MREVSINDMFIHLKAGNKNLKGTTLKQIIENFIKKIRNKLKKSVSDFDINNYEKLDIFIFDKF